MSLGGGANILGYLYNRVRITFTALSTSSQVVVDSLRPIDLVMFALERVEGMRLTPHMSCVSATWMV